MEDTTTLPRFIVLQSNKNGKYLRHIPKNTETPGILLFSGEEVVSPHTKFEVELADSEENEGLVHIKCCYNNKYWVCHENQQWIAADAHEKEEDNSKWSCTLFKPKFLGSNKVSLFHVFHKRYTVCGEANAPHIDCLYAEKANTISVDFLTYIDRESLSMLPKHIAFKGSNELYLSACKTDGRMYLEFNCNDIADETVGNQVFINHDGSIRIKSIKTGKFWRRSPNWIWPESDDTTQGDLNTCFKVIRVNSNTIALLNLGNNEYCKSLTTEGKTNCLNASADTIWKDTHLQVEEFVTKREIYNVRYHVSDARIYDEKILNTVTQSTTNNSDAPEKQTIQLKYTKEESQTWNASVSLKLGVETSIKAGIPSIGEGEVKVSAEFESKYEWGKTMSKSEEITTDFEIEVRPMTRINGSVIATRASCDIPYSYSQRDTLKNGTEVIYNMDDGIYTGSHTLKFLCEIKQSSLLERQSKHDKVIFNLDDCSNNVPKEKKVIYNTDDNGNVYEFHHRGSIEPSSLKKQRESEVRDTLIKGDYSNVYDDFQRGGIEPRGDYSNVYDDFQRGGIEPSSLHKRGDYSNVYDDFQRGGIEPSSLQKRESERDTLIKGKKVDDYSNVYDSQPGGIKPSSLQKRDSEGTQLPDNNDADGIEPWLIEEATPTNKNADGKRNLKDYL